MLKFFIQIIIALTPYLLQADDSGFTTIVPTTDPNGKPTVKIDGQTPPPSADDPAAEKDKKEKQDAEASVPKPAASQLEQLRNEQGAANGTSQLERLRAEQRNN